MNDSDLTLRGLIDRTVARLAPLYGQGEAKAMTGIIVEEVLRLSAVDVALRKDTEISRFSADRVDAVVDRLLRWEPIQYVFGHARFYGGTVEVNDKVLIPRPETEELVDLVVRRWGRVSDLRVMDFCTGSGCIAVTLARVLPFASVTGVDISGEAFEVARRNAALQHVRVEWRQADVLALTPPAEPCLDIITANPPYVLDSERASMDANVLDYEPHLALFVPDADPLRFYGPICRYAAAALRPGGYLYMEINPIFADDVRRLMASSGLEDAVVLPDISGRMRIAEAKSPLQP